MPVHSAHKRAKRASRHPLDRVQRKLADIQDPLVDLGTALVAFAFVCGALVLPWWFVPTAWIRWLVENSVAFAARQWGSTVAQVLRVSELTVLVVTLTWLNRWLMLSLPVAPKKPSDIQQNALKWKK